MDIASIFKSMLNRKARNEEEKQTVLVDLKEKDQPETENREEGKKMEVEEDDREVKEKSKTNVEEDELEEMIIEGPTERNNTDMDEMDKPDKATDEKDEDIDDKDEPEIEKEQKEEQMQGEKEEEAPIKEDDKETEEQELRKEDNANVGMETEEISEQNAEGVVEEEIAEDEQEEIIIREPKTTNEAEIKEQNGDDALEEEKKEEEHGGMQLRRSSRKRKATSKFSCPIEKKKKKEDEDAVKAKTVVKKSLRIIASPKAVAAREQRVSRKQWEVKEIVGHRMEKGVLMYKISWKGRGYKRVFRPVDCLSCPDLLDEYHERIGVDPRQALKGHKEKEWDVKSILSHRMKKGILRYKVEWEGDEYKPSYEPAKNLKCEKLLSEYHKQIGFDPRKSSKT